MPKRAGGMGDGQGPTPAHTPLIAGQADKSESEMSLVPDAALSDGSGDLDESYDPVKEFEELLDACGWQGQPTKKDTLWRKALYCRYRCRIVNLDRHEAHNTWAEVVRFVGLTDWKALKVYSIRKFLQLPAVDDVGTRNIFDQSEPGENGDKTETSVGARPRQRYYQPAAGGPGRDDDTRGVRTEGAPRSTYVRVWQVNSRETVPWFGRYRYRVA